MDLQEFQEADVLWPENSDVHRNDEEGGGVDGGDAMACNAAASVVLAKVSHSPELSVPVHVPRRKRLRRSRSWTSDQSSDGNCSGDDGGGDVGCTNDAKRTVLPPHVLAARRRRLGGRTAAAYSMCAGKGRTLKGRDLRNVRNLVLQMTGFIEK